MIANAKVEEYERLAGEVDKKGVLMCLETKQNVIRSRNMSCKKGLYIKEQDVEGLMA